MPYYSEVTDAGCEMTELSCPIWLADYLYDIGPEYETTYQKNPINEIMGYWTLSSYWGFRDVEWDIAAYGYTHAYSTVSNSVYFGVRPVINIKL